MKFSLTTLDYLTPKKMGDRPSSSKLLIASSQGDFTVKRIGMKKEAD